LEAKFAVVDHHEIIPRPVHFCKVNQHAQSLPKLGQAGKRAGLPENHWDVMWFFHFDISLTDADSPPSAH
jgi:hypothetical protein